MLQRQIKILILILMALLDITSLCAQQPLPKIVLAENGWNGGSNENITMVLQSAARELWKHMDHPALKPLIVSNGKGGPIVYYKRGQNGEYRVRLNTGGKYWSQYSYQFSHEFCHILCGYKDADRSNLWFEETICETASLFSLRAMSESWKRNPPYKNWQSFSPNLLNYAQERIEEHQLKLDDETSLKTFYNQHALHLRTNPTDRTKNTAMAIELLKLFEEQPEHWNAIQFLNNGRHEEPQSFADYLYNWRMHCPLVHQRFVDRIIELFGVPPAKQ